MENLPTNEPEGGGNSPSPVEGPADGLDRTGDEVAAEEGEAPASARGELGGAKLATAGILLLVLGAWFGASQFGRTHQLEAALEAAEPHERLERLEEFLARYPADQEGLQALGALAGWHELKLPPPRAPARILHGLAPEPSGGVVLFGGVVQEGDPQPFGDTWVWRRQGSFMQRRPASEPAHRQAHSMVFDLRRGVVVLFGGQGDGGEFLGDTWEWNGLTWTEIEFADGEHPLPRARHAMVYDEGRGETVLFAGSQGQGDLGDTWTFDGERWTNRSVTGPPPRGGHAMAVDPGRGAVVLFGGRSQSLNQLDDTWEWNGSQWRELTPPSRPSGRYVHGMCYCPLLEEVVLFGGLAGVLLDDTWSWDGSRWRQIPQKHSPLPRGGHRLVLPSSEGDPVLFGGHQGSSPLNDLWRFGLPDEE